MTEVVLKNIYKIYDNKVPAVEDFNLHIRDKEFIVFVGPSGCGKSTTLRMIAGLEEISKGDLYIDERYVNDVLPKDRDIAMVFQNYALYPHMTVYDNMAFGLKIRKLRKDEIERRVSDAAKILGLEELLKRKPNALSGGQRQRVALGHAIVRDAKLFLMDEPLSNLDAKLRVTMRSEISKLHHRLQTTTIYVTHDQIEAMTMATRLVVMKDGRIQQIGTPKEIYDTPENVFVGGFIGSPAMNFFTGKVENDHFMLGYIKLDIPEEKLEILREKGYENKNIILGIRPEHISDNLSVLNVSSDSVVNVKIEVAELLGAESMIYATLHNQSFAARLDTHKVYQVGKSIQLVFNMNEAQFFDAETQMRIKNPAEMEGVQ